VGPAADRRSDDPDSLAHSRRKTIVEARVVDNPAVVSICGEIRGSKAPSGRCTPGAPPEERIADRDSDPVVRPWTVPVSNGTHSPDMPLGSDSKGSENIVRSECSLGPAR